MLSRLKRIAHTTRGAHLSCPSHSCKLMPVHRRTDAILFSPRSAAYHDEEQARGEDEEERTAGAVCATFTRRLSLDIVNCEFFILSVPSNDRVELSRIILWLNPFVIDDNSSIRSSILGFYFSKRMRNTLASSILRKTITKFLPTVNK